MICHYSIWKMGSFKPLSFWQGESGVLDEEDIIMCSFRTDMLLYMLWFNVVGFFAPNSGCNRNRNESSEYTSWRSSAWFSGISNMREDHSGFIPKHSWALTHWDCYFICNAEGFETFFLLQFENGCKYVHDFCISFCDKTVAFLLYRYILRSGCNFKSKHSFFHLFWSEY